MNLNLKRLACLLTLTAVTLCLPATSSAGLINLLVGNVDVEFDGATGELTDLNLPAGGNGNPAEAREASSFEMEVGGVPEFMIMNPPTPLHADLKVTNLGSELSTNVLVSGAGGSGDPMAFGFDLFTNTGGLVSLGIDDISYTVIDFSGFTTFSFVAEAKVLSQNLPNGRVLEEDVVISYSASDVAGLTGQNGFRTLMASGNMTITGNMAVPEPMSYAFLALAAPALTMVRRRRR